jgi:hypothetical protein
MLLFDTRAYVWDPSDEAPQNCLIIGDLMDFDTVYNSEKVDV